MANKTNSNSKDCPCGTGKPYSACCEPFHLGTPAPTAETLMRSRYTAYVQQLADYLLGTWHPVTRPAELEFTDEQPIQWLGLEVMRAESTGADSALVEFVARYKVNGKAERLHETSRFSKEHGYWFYVDGDLA
jgi:SEC-C motif-containing protein